MVKLINPYLLGIDVGTVRDQEAFVICPFHDDHNPSAHLDLDNGLFYCFACGASSNAKSIAEMFGGQVVRESLSTTGIAALAGVLMKAEETPPAVQAFRRAQLAIDHPYMKQRGVSNELVEMFDIRQGQNVVMFPIKQAGELVGIQCRFKHASVKYKIFGQKLPIWPFDDPIQPGYPLQRGLVLVEGVFGVLRAFSFGFTNVRAVMSATSTKRLPVDLLPFGTRVAFDADSAGIIGAATLVHRSPIKVKMILPGQETDELNRDEWERLYNELNGTDNIEFAASLCEDPTYALAQIRKAKP